MNWAGLLRWSSEAAVTDDCKNTPKNGSDSVACSNCHGWPLWQLLLRMAELTRSCPREDGFCRYKEAKNGLMGDRRQSCCSLVVDVLSLLFLEQ